MEASTGLIEVTRLPTRWRDRGLRYVVLIDGEQRAELKPGESARLELASGQHEVKIGAVRSRGSSHTLALELHPGAVVSLVCETGGSARSGLRDLARGFEGWIALRYAD